MSDEPVVALSERTRRAAAAFLVLLAVVHLLFPDLAIDGVFLGLLALAAVVLFFDIQSVDALGVKARAREVRAVTRDVEKAEIPEALEAPDIPQAPVPFEGTPLPPTVHREALDLMPPTEPVARILWAVEQIRIEMIVLAGTAGYLKHRKPWSGYRLQELAPLLETQGVVPPAFARSLDPIIESRNALAHGEPLRRDLLTSIDELAVTLVARLREVPRTYNRVVAPQLDLFRDQSLTTPHEVHGVLLDQRDRDGNVLIQKVFPTEQVYERGRFLSWEWDMTKGTDEEAWYLDPTTQRPKAAFSSAAMFAGREFPEQWGLQYRAGPLTED